EKQNEDEFIRNGKLIKDGKRMEFWEAWKVKNNKVYAVHVQMNAEVEIPAIDTFAIRGVPAGHKGYVHYHGWIKFMENYQLDPKDGWNNGTEARPGLLPWNS